MVLEGTVTNVAAFGAFVDVGVHQDGLVHVSALANRFVSDPREVVKSGQVVRVKVLEADPERKRISLTLRLDDEPAASGGRSASGGRAASGGRTAPQQPRAGGKRPEAKSADARKTGAGQGGAGQRAAAQAPKAAPKPAPANTAMAEALRRAGLGK